MENNNNYQDPREIDLDESPVIEEEHVEESSEEENDSNDIVVTLINGESYAISPDNIDWDAMWEGIDKMKDNLNSIRTMIYHIMKTYDPIYCNTVIEDINTFTKGFGITLDYSSINPSMTIMTKAIIMCVDTLIIIMTIIHETHVRHLIDSCNEFSFDETHAMEFLSMLNESQHDGSECDCKCCDHNCGCMHDCDNNEDVNENETMEEK